MCRDLCSRVSGAVQGQVVYYFQLMVTLLGLQPALQRLTHASNLKVRWLPCVHAQGRPHPPRMLPVAAPSVARHWHVKCCCRLSQAHSV